MKRVLVTGATGFIGRHSLAGLLAADYEVHAVTLEPPLVDPSSVVWHRADLLDTHHIPDLLATVRPSHLLHFAWYATPGRYWIAPENLQWVQASLGLLQAFTHAGGRRVVMAGTCAEYDWNYGFCSEAITPLAPRTLYGVCKHALQMMLTSYARDKQLSSVASFHSSRRTACRHGGHLRRIRLELWLLFRGYHSVGAAHAVWRLQACTTDDADSFCTG